jgi:hypothetical protein
MMTPHMKERMLVLCALIAEEKDHDKFLRLVVELNDVFEDGSAGVEPASSTATRPTTKVGNISPQA